MCCRLRLDKHQLTARGGGLFAADPLTGSIGVVTVNMPQIGFRAQNEKDFLAMLDSVLQVAKTSLETKRKLLERLTEQGLYPYSRFYLRGIKERSGQYWANHFSTIGLVGMNEACLNLLGCDIGSSEGSVFAGSVLDHIRMRLHEFQQETGNLYNLEATPAEGASCRLAKLDKEKFPDIICANNEETAKGAGPFYTNSTQLPVKYFTITPTYSVCPAHGYIKGNRSVCPQCSNPTEVYSRVVGYLRPVNQWNEGKQAEFENRRTFSVRGF
ncbi:MAG: hypothetical protein B6I25_04835 [Planctomycetales bacterium 4572_13]|nr:MAG: hypothetical protein B6I25_04835 [Planctomycetales bacterium 4572_13]